MTYEEAFCYKLLLQARACTQDKYDAWLNAYLEAENPLSPIVLSLAECGDDLSRIISCLHRFTLDKPIDQNKVFDLIWRDLHNRYLSDELDRKQCMHQMNAIALASGNYWEEPWHTMALLDEFYEIGEEGIIDINEVIKDFEQFIQNKQTLTPLSAKSND